MGGTDGATGIVYTNGPPLVLEEAPIEYCSTLDERYRYQCVFEFSGLGVHTHSTPEQIAEKLKQCTGGDFDEKLEGGCIQSVAAVGTQHELALRDAITFPPHILNLTDFQRRSYIIGAGTEMKQYLISGADRDWRSFCANFTNQADVTLCHDIFDN